MELLESIGWIALGFVPTLLSLQVWYKINSKRKSMPKFARIQSS